MRGSQTEVACVTNFSSAALVGKHCLPWVCFQTPLLILLSLSALFLSRSSCRFYWGYRVCFLSLSDSKRLIGFVRSPLSGRSRLTNLSGTHISLSPQAKSPPGGRGALYYLRYTTAVVPICQGNSFPWGRGIGAGGLRDCTPLHFFALFWCNFGNHEGAPGFGCLRQRGGEWYKGVV